MTRKAVPDKDARWVDDQGRPTQALKEYLDDLDKRAPREKVSTATPANGDVLTFNATTNEWEPT